MQVIEKKNEAHGLVRGWQERGVSTGLVPTMGALHQGHMSLIGASLGECERTVVSVFLNPAQFGEGEDLDRYPCALDHDLELLRAAGVDMVFIPDAGEMYPGGFCTWVVQEVLTERLCGAFRPGHFRGVCTVVAKLLAIVPAGRAYFGRKDLQQCAVIKRMVVDLDIPVGIRVMPVVRESDGLALSSRNCYLSAAERDKASCLYEGLLEARGRFECGQKDADALLGIIGEHVNRSRMARMQYAEIVDPDTLAVQTTASPNSVAAVAAFFGGTRLIDNMPLGGELQDTFLPPSAPGDGSV